ncbi:MAG: PorT family protein [Odoribacter sp.]|nr:PorT family protein [Odoribacter sp.]
MIRSVAVMAIAAAAFLMPSVSLCETPLSYAERSSVSVGASFDVNIPSGSHGMWNPGSGVTISADYVYRLTPRWFLTAGLGGFYRTFGTEYMIQDNSIFEGTVKNIGLRVPLMAGFTAPVSDGVEMSVATGPQLEINLYARESAMPDFVSSTMQPVGASTVNMFKRGFKRVNALWGIALGFTFAEHYYVGLAGNVAFTPLASYGNRDNKIKIRGNSVAVKLCYSF